jgi:hypothetical protein
LFAIGVAYFYLGMLVLPVAFSGLALGYLLGKKKQYGMHKLGYAAVGYLVGFVAGLEIVILQLPRGSPLSGIPKLILSLCSPVKRHSCSIR